MFPNVQSESPLVQLKAIPFCPITVTGETRPTTTSPQPPFQAVVESSKISPETPPDWTIPAPSATPRKTCAPDPSQLCCPFNSLSLFHQAGHLIIGDEVGHTGPAFHESMLARPDLLVVPCILYALTQDGLFHNLPWHQGQADRPLVPQILLTTLLVDRSHAVKHTILWDLSSWLGILIDR